MSTLQLAWRSIKTNMQYVAGMGAVSVSVFLMYPHVWGLDRNKRLLQMYRNDEPQDADEESKKMAQQVFDKVLWDTSSEASIELFTAYGQDTIHRGSTFSRYGGIVGIPVNFQYRTVEDVEKEKITLNNQIIDWTSPAGKQLLDSMVLSEKGRRFAVARELFYLHTYHMHVRGVMVGVSMFFAYWMGAATNAAYDLRRRLPVGSRAVIYGFFAGAGATLYCFGSDSYEWFRDRKVDRQAAELGAEYAVGGVEFYNKLLQRNMALRTLMGSEGGKRYTAYGNDIHFWRSPTVPLTSRRDALLESIKSARSPLASQEKSTTSESADTAPQKMGKVSNGV